MSEWINVESPPKQSGHYLCYIETDDVNCIASLDYEILYGHWVHEGEPTYCKSYYFNPTYWMELPSPPTNENK